MADPGFTGPSYVTASITQDDQDAINWFCKIDPLKADENPETPHDRGHTTLYPAPGTVAVIDDLAAGEWRALMPLPGGTQMLGVMGNTLYLIESDFSYTDVGTLATYSGIVGMTNNNVAALIVDGEDRYTYTWSTDTFATVIDGPFDGATSCDIIDNFMIYNRPDTNQWGCTDAGDTASNALNLGSMLGSSGNIVAVIADHRQVLIIGEQYSERHVNVGSSPFPFSIVPGSSIQHGCAAKYSLARFGEGMAFLAKDSRGSKTVIMWGAAITEPKRISNDAVEQAINKYAVIDDAIGYSYAQAGSEFYMLTFPSANVTWCYDLSTGYWHKRAWRDPLNVYHRHRSNCQAAFGGLQIVGDWENGKLYNLSLEVFSDDGEPLPCLRRCRHLTSDLNRQFFSNLQIQFQPGVGLQTGQGSDPACWLRWSNDGGHTFGNYHELKLGKVGKYKHRAIKRRIGSARDRIFELLTTDPVFRVVVSAEMRVTPGAN